MTDTTAQRDVTPEGLHEKGRWQPHWTIEKWAREDDFLKGEQPDEVVEIDGNLLLTAGVTLLWDLTCAIGTNTAFSNANARIGVGDSTTAAVASQTGLQAATNKTYKAMNATYPSVSTNQVSFQSTFGSADANYSWQEFVVDNGTTSLNRLVSNQGTKASGSTWQVTLTVSLS